MYSVIYALMCLLEALVEQTGTSLAPQSHWGRSSSPHQVGAAAAAAAATLTLFDSIMPVLAWNLTVFNRARSFFSTLEKTKKKEHVNK